MTKKDWLFSMTLSLIIAVLLGIGFWAGRYTTGKKFSHQIATANKAATLGKLIHDPQERAAAVRVYSDAAGALQKIDEISWAVPNMPTPFVGNAPIPGRHGTATINAMQFRADTEIVMPKPAHTYRIFLTGGSVAYGSGAPSQQQTIAGYLSQLINNWRAPDSDVNYEVFTAANPAWASTHERIMIENRLSELQPDMVIMFAGNNDVHWGRLGRNILWFRSYADEAFFKLIKTVYSLNNLPDFPEVMPIADHEIPADLVAQRLMKNVELSAHVLAGANSRSVFVLQPTLAVTRKALTERERHSLKYQGYFQDCYAKIDQTLRGFQANNWQYINLSTVFDGLGIDQDIFLDSYHFGDKGNAIIAEQIFINIRDSLQTKPSTPR